MAVSPIKTSYPDWQSAVSAIAGVLNRVIGGERNSIGRVTLTPDADYTTVTDQRVGVNRMISLGQPITANAAAAIPTTYIDPADIGVATFKIRHANNSQTDRTFNYEIKG